MRQWVQRMARMAAQQSHQERKARHRDSTFGHRALREVRRHLVLLRELRYQARGQDADSSGLFPGQ